MLKSKKFFLSLFILFLMAVFALNPALYAKTTLDGITLWALSIVPSVFFYFVLTALLTSISSISLTAKKFHPLTKKVFGCGGLSIYAFFMSVLSGYPTGSKITADLYQDNLISSDEAVKISGLSSTSGFLFVISTTGGMLKSTFLGLIIFLSHVLSVLLCALFFRNKGKTIKNFERVQTKDTDNVIYESIYGSIVSVLVLGGIITVFYTLTEMLFNVGILNGFIKAFNLVFGDEKTSRAFLTAIFESIKGIKLLSLSDHPLKIPLIGFAISFGGFSVITQSLIFLKRAKIKTAVFLISKLIHAVFCFLILFILSLLNIV